MIEALQREVTTHGDRVAVVRVQRLQEIRQDLAELRSRERLNHFQQYILSDLYQFDAPETGFEARSIFLVASPSPAAIQLTFRWQGERVPLALPASYVDKDRAPARIEGYLSAYLAPRGYHVRYAPQLPRKRLAVRSGLGAYGRNNLCYVEGMGSFLNLTPFVSDLPCPVDAWQAVRQMELCHTCRACLRACPTGAILPDRFLLDNERCLTYFNEAGGWDFPGWIDPAAHHTLYGCLRCQAACPVNRPFLNTMDAPVEFSEAETALLLAGQAFELFPAALQQKVTALQMVEYLGALPRNMRALLNQGR